MPDTTTETEDLVSTIVETTEDLGSRHNVTGSDEPGTVANSNGSQDSGNTDDEPDTFPRSVVEDLRKENATYRTKAKDRDDLAHRLHTALVAATGRLADPSDLDFDEAHLGDEEALNAALDALLDAKPHLASRRPRGDVGQGMSGLSETVDLAGILRSRA